MLTYPNKVTISLVQLIIIDVLSSSQGDEREPELCDLADEWARIFREGMPR